MGHITSSHPWKDLNNGPRQLAKSILQRVLLEEYRRGFNTKAIQAIQRIVREYEKCLAAATHQVACSECTQRASNLLHDLTRSLGPFDKSIYSAFYHFTQMPVFSAYRSPATYIMDEVANIVDIDEIEGEVRARDAGLTNREAIQAFLNIWLAGSHDEAYRFAERMLSYGET